MAYDILSSCMLVPGFSRGECASWVQAWGSVLAIGAAIWISNRQHARELQRVRASDGLVARNRLDCAIAAVSACEGPLNVAVEAMRSGGDVELRYFADEFNAEGLRLAGVLVGKLPITEIANPRAMFDLMRVEGVMEECAKLLTARPRMFANKATGAPRISVGPNALKLVGKHHDELVLLLNVLISERERFLAHKVD